MPVRSMFLADTRRRSADAACPGLFRIVPARDGGICRLKLPLGRLSAAQASVVADVAARRGSGIIDITNRANLQIRGITAVQASGVAEALIEAGLGPAQPEGDDIRNIMVSPTAGIDPGQIRDVRHLAQALLNHVQGDMACRALSPKFSFLVDGGEDMAVVDHPHDIWLASLGPDRMAIGFAGCPPVSANDTPAAGAIRESDAIDVIAAAIALFLEAAGGDPRITRLRHLFAAQSREAFVERLSKRAGDRMIRDAGVASWRRQSPVRLSHVGIGRQRQEGLFYVGAVPPVGRLSPVILTEVARIAEQCGCGDVHLTPWQSLLVPSIREGRTADTAEALGRLGLVCDPRAPLASLIACAGSPGCSAGLSDTKADTLRLARGLSGTDTGTRTLHLSGCPKSCASAATADVTLVALAPGLYDLYERDQGAQASRFGRLRARGVTVEQAARLLDQDDEADDA